MPPTDESDKDYFIEIKKSGFVTNTVQINSEVNDGYVILDVLFTGLVGVIIDATTGAWYTFDENDIGVILQPLSTIEKDSTLNQ